MEDKEKKVILEFVSEKTLDETDYACSHCKDGELTPIEELFVKSDAYEVMQWCCVSCKRKMLTISEDYLSFDEEDEIIEKGPIFVEFSPTTVAAAIEEFYG